MNTTIRALLAAFFILTGPGGLAACLLLMGEMRHDYQSQNGKIHRALIIRDGVWIIVAFAIGIAGLIGLLYSFGVTVTFTGLLHFLGIA